MQANYAMQCKTMRNADQSGIAGQQVANTGQSDRMQVD